MPLISTDLRADALRARYGKRYPWLVLAVAALGIVASVLATTSFSVASPAIMQQYGLGQEQAQWTMTGFMAAMARGKLRDARRGARRRPAGRLWAGAGGRESGRYRRFRGR